MKAFFGKFETYIRFLKDNKQVVYAVVLIVLIPLILAVNTFVVVDSMGKNMDYELRLKAELAGSIVASYSADYLDSATVLQKKVDEVKADSLYGAVDLVEILVPEGEDFKVVASTQSSQVGQVMPQWHYAFAWHEKQSVASLVKQKVEGNEERVWRIVTPIVDEGEEKKGLVDIGVSTAYIDAQTQAVLLKSLVVLGVSIFIVLLLIINNARLFEYALLFHKLKEVDEMKDEFISIASHELKTPVTAARGFLCLVQQQSDKIDEQIKADLDKSLQCMDRLTELVADLLDVSRIEQNRLQMALHEVDVSEVISEVVGHLKSQADNKGLYLIYQQPTDSLPLIMADKAKFRQVMMNLMSNAIKYTFKGRVEVIVEYDMVTLSVSVKDTGIGMSAEERQRLFEKFYRVRSRKSKDVVGTGLGLWITKQLVEMMGGKIYVDSIEDVGSKFTVSFSLADKIEDGNKVEEEE